MSRKVMLALALAAAFAQGLGAEEAAGAPGRDGGFGPLSVASSLDWKARTIRLDLSLDMEGAGLRLPAGRIEAERIIEAELPGAIKAAALGVPVDSWRTVQDCINDGSLDEGALLGLAERAAAGPAAFSKDMRRYGASYSLGLSELAALFVRHRSAVPLEASLEYRPSRAYTGIVIRVKGSLPVHGEHAEASVSPCLFPRVYDEGMKPIVDRNAVDPAAILAWGEIGYATSLDLEDLKRVGEDPLRIEAAGIFGTRRTDVVISRDDALKIRALAENRALVAAGRVILVVDETGR